MATPGCLRHITRSGWCLAMVVFYLIDCFIVFLADFEPLLCGVLTAMLCYSALVYKEPPFNV